MNDELIDDENLNAAPAGDDEDTDDEETDDEETSDDAEDEADETE